MNPFLEFFKNKGTDLIKVVADKIGMDKAQAAQFQLDFQKEAQAMDMAELDAAKSIIVAEANSADKWTSRARPSFMYVFYVLLLLTPVMGITYAINPVTANNVIVGFQKALAAIPDIMWQTFGVGYVGYSASRTVEKHLEGKRAEAAKK